VQHAPMALQTQARHEQKASQKHPRARHRGGQIHFPHTVSATNWWVRTQHRPRG
jgi:hypothetical protein